MSYISVCRKAREVKDAKRKQIEKNVNRTIKDTVAYRVDMARIVMDWGNFVLQLVEVKSATYKGALRADLKKNGIPKVIGQMNKYSRFIEEQKPRILDSYSKIADNYLSLELTDAFPNKLNGVEVDAKKILNMLRDRRIIDVRPHLLIFGDQQQMIGKSNYYAASFD